MACAPRARRRSTPRPPPRRRSRHRGRQEQERRRRHGPCAARGLLGGRRRTLALHRGHHDAGLGDLRSSTTACILHRPDAGRRPGPTPRHPLGSATFRRCLDPTSRRRAYLYHVTRFRLGDATTIGTPMPSFDPHRGAERRRRHAGRQEVGRQRRPAVRGRLPAGLHHALRRPAGGLREDHRSRRRPEHRAGLRPAEQDAGLPAQGADRGRHRHALHRFDLGPASPEAAKAVVLTSHRVGSGRRQRHHRPARQPGRRRAALVVSVSRQGDHASTPPPTPPARSPARPPRSSTRSTPTRTPPRWSPRRCTAPTPARASSRPRPPPSKLSDWLNAPATYPRGPQTVKMIRIGNDVGTAARRSASSSTARSTPASGAPRWSASRPPSGSCATTPPIPRRRT